MALDPAAVARQHVWDDLSMWATRNAKAALDGLGRAKAQDDKEYLTARAETFQKIAAGARTKLEAKP